MHATRAPLTDEGRRILCERIDAGTPIAHVAAAVGVSRQTLSKWYHRWLAEGHAGLVDRRSTPHRQPTRTPQRTERRIIGLRVNRRWGPARIAGHLHMNPSTVWRVLRRYGISRLRDLDPPTGRVIRRYEASRPGELIHVDIKKFGRIPKGGGHRVHGRGKDPKKGKAKVGYTYLHSAVDDHSRLAYSEFLPDEQATTATGFTMRAMAWFASHGAWPQTVMTDNGSCYRAKLFFDTLDAWEIHHIRTRPYRPQTNGKVERYQRTLATEWAYTRSWNSDTQREADLPNWLHEYNHHRYHTAISGTPSTRVNHLWDHNS